MSKLQQVPNGGIYAQRYDANGAASGAEFQVNTYTTSNQIFPSIAALSDGGFVVIWTSYGQDDQNVNGGIYANAIMQMVLLVVLSSKLIRIQPPINMIQALLH